MRVPVYVSERVDSVACGGSSVRLLHDRVCVSALALSPRRLETRWMRLVVLPRASVRSRHTVNPCTHSTVLALGTGVCVWGLTGALGHSAQRTGTAQTAVKRSSSSELSRTFSEISRRARSVEKVDDRRAESLRGGLHERYHERYTL